MENLFSIENEQQLLGALMVNNGLITRISGIIRKEDFSSAVHGKIFELICKKIDQGGEANAVTLTHFFESEPELDAVGGSQYIAELEAGAVCISGIADYAEAVRDLSLRRHLIAEADKLKAELAECDWDKSARALAAEYSGVISRASISSRATSNTALELIDRIAKDADKDSLVTPTGLSRIDSALVGGLHTGRLYAIAARMKAGKTTLMATISYNISINRGRVLYLCLEMTGQEIMQRILARHVGVNALDFLRADTRKTKRITSLYQKAASDLGPDNFTLTFEDCPGISLEMLLARIAEAGASGKYDGIVIDYLQLVTGAQKSENEANFHARVAQRVAETTKKWPNIWILTAVQLNREGEVRGSDGIRMACDMLLRLETKIIEDGSATGQVEAWLEMEASRYTPTTDIGREDRPALALDKNVGPYYREI